MKERPILFSGPMIRAILDGRKAQTRRAVKVQPNPLIVAGAQLVDRVWCWLNGHDGSITGKVLGNGRCPYGQTSDRLWVRETCRAKELPSGLDGVRYMADDAFVPIANTSEASDAWLDLAWYGKRASPASPIKTVPAIHMPRWASRITLEIVGVRVERLQDISRDDAIAEGVCSLDGSDGPNFWTVDTGDDVHLSNPTAQGAYAMLWDWINGPGSWDANPWVWCIEFRRLP